MTPLGLWARAREMRWELAAAVVITAAVVGLPWLTNGGLAGGSPDGSAITTTTGPLPDSPIVLGANTEIDTPAAPAGPVDDDFLALLHSVTAPPITPGTTVPATTPTTTAAATTTTVTTSGPSTTSPTTAPPKRPTPKAPTRLALDFTGTALLARWDAVTTESDGSPFSGLYEITVRSANGTKTYQTTTPAFTYTLDQNRLDFGVPQSELTLTIRAVDASGTPGPTATGVAVHDPPATPGGAPILAAGTTQISITGQVPPGSDDVAGFDIYEYSLTSSPAYVFLGSTTGLGAFVHDGLTPGSTHTYVYKTRDVFGQDSAGYSPAATATAL